MLYSLYDIILRALQLNPEDHRIFLSVSFSLKKSGVLRARHAVFCFFGSKRLRLSPPTIRQILISFDIGIFIMQASIHVLPKIHEANAKQFEHIIQFHFS